MVQASCGGALRKIMEKDGAHRGGLVVVQEEDGRRPQDRPCHAERPERGERDHHRPQPGPRRRRPVEDAPLERAEEGQGLLRHARPGRDQRRRRGMIDRHRPGHLHRFREQLL